MTIHLNRIGKRFNREWIFRELSAHYQSGQTVAISGPNGSGKSTLLSVLWSQTPPSEGEIRYELNGHSVEPEMIFRELSLAAPYMDLIEDFTLLEHLDFHFSFKECVAGTLAELPERIGLKKFAQQPVRTFSSGMKQRLRLALALYSRAEITFLDEPTTNLDEHGVRWYQHEINNCGKRLIFIASNIISDFPSHAVSLNLTEFKLS